MATTTLHTTDALGIVLELMDLIGHRITLTRVVTDRWRYDDDGRLHVTPVHESVAGELHDVRTIQRGGNTVRVTLITGEDERVCFTHEVLLQGERTGPVSGATRYAVTVHG